MVSWRVRLAVLLAVVCFVRSVYPEGYILFERPYFQFEGVFPWVDFAPRARGFRAGLFLMSTNSAELKPLYPQSNLVPLPDLGAWVNPVIVSVPGHAPGELVRVVPRLYDGETLIAWTEEATVWLGGRENPPRPDFLMPTYVYNYETVRPKYLDVHFNPTFVRDGSTNGLKFAAVHPERTGRIVATGNFTEVNAAQRDGVVRLNADGTTDTEFENPLPEGAVVEESLSAGGTNYYLAGSFTFTNGSARLVRVDENGRLDAAFAPGAVTNAVSALAMQPDGRVLVGVEGPARLIRLMESGEVDQSFSISEFAQGGNPTRIYAIHLAGTNGIWVGGDFDSRNGVETGSLVQLDGNGLVNSRVPPIVVRGPVYAIATDVGGWRTNLIIGGAFTNVNGFACPSGLATFQAPTNVYCWGPGMPMGTVKAISENGRAFIGESERGSYAFYGLYPFGNNVSSIEVSGSDFYLAGAFSANGRTVTMARYSTRPTYEDNRLLGIDWYDTFLLLRPQHAYGEVFEFSSDLKTWHVLPEGIRDSNVGEGARFYRIQPR